MNNVVGKLLVILNLVFCLCLMCFAGAVYFYSNSWRDVATKAERSLAEERQNIDDLRTKKEEDEKALQAEVTAQKNRADSAEAKLNQLETDRSEAVGSRQLLAGERDKLVTDLAIAQKETNDRTAESNELRAEVTKLRERTNELIAERRVLEDLNLDLNGALAAAREQETKNLEQITDLRNLLRFHGVDPNDVVSGVVPQEIVKVDGNVLGSQKNSSGSQEFVLISIGSDDLITRGMKLIVYRQRRYLCQIQITEVQADQAVGLVLEETRNGTIERGDDVTTKL